MSNAPLITYLISPFAIPYFLLALIGLVLVLVVWRKRSPIVIVCTVLVSLIVLAQFSFLLWLANSWGRNNPENLPTPAPYIHNEDPHHDGHPRMNGGLFDV